MVCIFAAIIITSIMSEITLTVNKLLVYNEVAKTTSYAGTKQMKGDDMSAYERYFTTDDDRLMLERFFNESADAVTDMLKEFIVSVSDHDASNGINLNQDYIVTIIPSSSFSEHLTNSIESSLFSFFVSAILSKWCKFINEGDADNYAKAAVSSAENVLQKVYYRKKPTRRAINS